PTGSSLELKQLFEERLRRPLGSPAITSFGSGGFGFGGRARQFWFQLEAELIVYGATDPAARVTLGNEPVKLRPDGTFTTPLHLRASRPPARATPPPPWPPPPTASMSAPSSWPSSATPSSSSR